MLSMCSQSVSQQASNDDDDDDRVISRCDALLGLDGLDLFWRQTRWFPAEGGDTHLDRTGDAWPSSHVGRHGGGQAKAKLFSLHRTSVFSSQCLRSANGCSFSPRTLQTRPDRHLHEKTLEQNA